jgi:hypothetical protein
VYGHALEIMGRCACASTTHILSVMVDEEEGFGKIFRNPTYPPQIFSVMLIHIFTVSF